MLPNKKSLLRVRVEVCIHTLFNIYNSQTNKGATVYRIADKYTATVKGLHISLKVYNLPPT